MAKQDLPTPEELRKLLRYDAGTGRLFWRYSPENSIAFNGRMAGKPALDHIGAKNGYRSGSIRCRRVYAHRVIMAMHLDRWPDLDIDHINGDRADNRLVNLREVTKEQNSRNTKTHSHNKSGITGVHWRESEQRWHACIGNKSKQVRLGQFRTKEEAIAARRAAEALLGYHENHGR